VFKSFQKFVYQVKQKSCKFQRNKFVYQLTRTNQEFTTQNEMGKYRALIKRFFVQHTGWLNLLKKRLLNSTSVYDCPNLLPLNKNV
jgi:hypothetical protein